MTTEEIANQLLSTTNKAMEHLAAQRYADVVEALKNIKACANELASNHCGS